MRAHPKASCQDSVKLASPRKRGVPPGVNDSSGSEYLASPWINKLLSPRIACSAADRSHSRRHEINGSGLRPGRRHADADEHANARENDQPHTAPRSADTAGPLISALPRLETTTEPENRRDPPHIGGPGNRPVGHPPSCCCATGSKGSTN